MTVFDLRDFDDHEHVSFFSDRASGLRAIVAIHSTAPFGIAGGGCRMWPYATAAEALTDALRLSRAMSYKLALADLPSGGAKTVVIGDPKKDKSEALWRALGRAVERLGGRYIIAEDVGTTPDDMRMIAKETKYVVGRQADTSPATAYGVFVGLRAAVAKKLGKSDLAGVRVAIQGAGNVGAGLCRHLAGQKAALWIADVDRARARRVAGELGATEVAPEAIHALDVDVFAPCALGAVLNDETIPELRCAIIAGGANNQLADEERHDEALRERNILYAPDFVINMGGVIGAAQEGMQLGGDEARGFDEKVAFSQTERIADVLGSVFHIAERDGIGTHQAAVRMAKDKIRQMRS